MKSFDKTAPRHAVWRNWPHVGECYRVRNRGSLSSFSRDGFCWFDSFGKATNKPGRAVKFYGGPRGGQIEVTP